MSVAQYVNYSLKNAGLF